MVPMAAGLFVYFKDYLKNFGPLREGLPVVFQESPCGQEWNVFNYELIYNNHHSVELHPSVSSRELAELLGRPEVLLTCGRFFSYPKGVQGKAIETFSQFFTSPCQTILLVYDVAFLELYSKDEAYLARCKQQFAALATPPEIEEIDISACPRKTFQI